MVLMYLYLCTFICLVHGLQEKEKLRLNVKNVSIFPLPYNKAFEITVEMNSKNSSRKSSMLDVMVIQINDTQGSDNERAVFDFGYKDKIDEDFNGDLMVITNWEKDYEKDIINATVFFTNYADNKTLEIYHLSPSSSKERRKMLNHLTVANRIYSAKITLFSPKLLEILVNGRQSSDIGIHPHDVNTATCRLIGGSGNSVPFFIENGNISVVSKALTKDNEMELKFRVTAEDHGKNLTCQFDAQKVSVRLNVYHHATQIFFEPAIGPSMTNDSGVTCVAKDGYPVPTVRWHFISGPEKASEFYQLSPYNQRLHMKSKAPISSRWQFECRATNKVGKNVGTYNRSVAFVIELRKENKTRHKESYLSKSNYWGVFAKENVTVTDLKRIIATQHVDIGKLKMNNAKQNNEIFSLKYGINKNKFDILQLSRSIKSLKQKNDEQNSELKTLKKSIVKDLKEFEKELLKIKLNAYQSSDRRAGITVVPKVSLIKPQSMVYAWTIHNFSRLRKKRKLIYSPEFLEKNIRSSMQMWLDLSERRVLRVLLSISEIFDADSSFIFSGTATITISNYVNPSVKKSVTLYFQRSRRGTKLEFKFDFMDLLLSQMFHGDMILIQLFIGE